MTLKVWHDSGHGGANRGVCFDGFVEKEWTLEFTEGFFDWHYIKCSYDEFFSIEPWTARHDDTNVKYNLRAQAAVEVGADVAFIHHINAIYYPKDYPLHLAGRPWPLHSGASAFVMDGDTESHKVGEVLLNAVRHPLRLWKGRTKPHWSKRFDGHGRPHWTNAAWSCLRHYAQCGIPAVLVEWSFITSDYDRRLITDTSKRELFYRPLSAAIRYALEQKEKSCNKQ